MDSRSGYYRRGESRRDEGRYGDRDRGKWSRDRSPHSYSRSYGSDRDSYDSRRSRSPPDYRYQRDSQRDRSRDYSRRESSPRSYRYDSHYSREDESLEPSPTIVIKGLPLSADEGTVWGLIGEQGYKPKDMRILRRRDSGQSRGFGFVEFAELSEAVSWMEFTQGYLRIDDRHTAELQYSGTKMPSGGISAMVEKGSTEAFDKHRYFGDWLCSECGTNNFKKRDHCFKCGITREESDNYGTTREGYSEIGMVPCDTILLRNLPKHTTEDRIQASIRRVSGAEAKNIVVARDVITQESRGFAYVQMSTLQEAMQLLTTLTAITTLSIDGRDVRVSYSRNSLTDVLNAASSTNTTTTTTVIPTPHIESGPVTVASTLEQTQADSANSAAAVAQNAMKKAQAVKQVQQAVLQEHINAAAATAASHASQVPITVPAIIPHQQTIFLPTNSGGHGGLILQSSGPALRTATGLPIITADAMAQAQLLQAQAQAARAQQLQQQAIRAQQAHAAAVLQQHHRQQQAAIAAAAQVAAVEGMAHLTAITTAPTTTASARSEPVNLGTVSTPYGDLPRYPPPDTSQYQYEETSGFYYDPTTGLYYDANTQYYYNGDTQQYLYWDGTYQTYLPAPTGDTADEEKTSENGETEKKPKKEKEKQEKVKIAKKIQKDMEKWAKAQNQRKEPKPALVTAADSTEETPQGPSRLSATADAAFLALEQQAGVAPITRAPKPPVHSLVAYDGGDSDEESSGNLPSNIKPPSAVTESPLAALAAVDDSIGDDELTDWSRMACLLCRRAFPSKEALVRHQQFSDLHKKNVELKKSTSPATSGLSQGQYRDRAKERRDKFGSQAIGKKTGKFKKP